MSEIQTKNKSLIVGGILFSFFIILASLFSTKIFQNSSFSKETVFFISRFSIWIGLLLIYIYSIKIEKQKFLIWSETKFSVWNYLKSVVQIMFSLLLVLVIFSVLMKIIGLKIESSELLKIVKILKSNFPLLVFTCLTAGITEELIFRAYLIPRLEQILKNNYLAILVSSLLFGSLHFGYGTIYQIIGPILIGLVFAFHYQKFRNIKILIVCHFLWDFMTLMIQTHLK